jgi:hypothetical protein
MLADVTIVLQVGVSLSGPLSLPLPRATFPALPSMIHQQLLASNLSKRKLDKLNKKFEVVVQVRSDCSLVPVNCTYFVVINIKPL